MKYMRFLFTAGYFLAVDSVTFELIDRFEDVSALLLKIDTSIMNACWLESEYTNKQVDNRKIYFFEEKNPGFTEIKLRQPLESLN
jgi:hypothetical protein